MLISHRIANKQLSDLCHRLGTSLAAGIDLRRTWKRETESARGYRKQEFARVQQAIERGSDWGEALAKTQGVFPSLFVEMVKVGEQTGQTTEVLQRLSRHYRMRYELTRSFLTLLSWPLLQFGIAIGVVGLLIWVLGALGSKNLDGTPTDALGLGLVGNQGVALYSLFVLLGLGAIAIVVVAIQRGALWIRPVQHWLTATPGLGIAIQKLCLARMAWTLHLLLNIEMDVRKVVPLALRSTGNDYYIRHTQQAVKDIASGQPLHLALAHTGAFPPHFLDALLTAEETGQISESMARLSKHYEEEAEGAMKFIATLVGVTIWIAIGAFILLLIFRIVTNVYLKPINDMLEI